MCLTVIHVNVAGMYGGEGWGGWGNNQWNQGWNMPADKVYNNIPHHKHAFFSNYTNCAIYAHTYNRGIAHVRATLP